MSEFDMQLATPESGTEFVNISFSGFVGKAPGSYPHPIIDEALGQELDYGSAFAYLFRRFGYPNAGWDDYKQLSKYLLTTARKDLLLQVTPHVSNSASLSVSFFIPMTALQEIDRYNLRHHVAWMDRLCHWYEANHDLPDWMDGLLKTIVDQGFDSNLTWRDAFWFITLLNDGDEPREAKVWRAETLEAYRAIEPEPARSERRDQDWNHWADDDPLKPYAVAAYEALNDLKRPVPVRDSLINVFGPVADAEPEEACQRAPVSGYPSGAMGNQDPETFAELHRQILILGEGDASTGMKRMLKHCQDLGGTT